MDIPMKPAKLPLSNLTAAPAYKNLPLQKGTPAALTQFDG
jgi:hypothetical protein